jgi:hypothetical protein
MKREWKLVVPQYEQKQDEAFCIDEQITVESLTKYLLVHCRTDNIQQQRQQYIPTYITMNEQQMEEMNERKYDDDEQYAAQLMDQLETTNIEQQQRNHKRSKLFIDLTHSRYEHNFVLFWLFSFV